MTFPSDTYTPFGYLANPFHRARSWEEPPEAGLLRSTDDAVGFGWVEPTARRPTLQADLVLVARHGERVYQTRADFGRLGYVSRHHSALVFSYDWTMGSLAGSLSYALAGRDDLVASLRVSNPGPFDGKIELYLLGRLRGKDARWTATLLPNRDGWRFVDAASGRTFTLTMASGLSPITPDEAEALAPELTMEDGILAGFRLGVDLEPGQTQEAGFHLFRGDPVAPERMVLPHAVIAARKAEDDAFYAEAMRPVGDWPSEWKRGWVYDLETTRACIFPPGGIFHAEWPSWMMSWPRVVVAEGTLDALRFSYAAPRRALGLAQTIFADAPAANVPCVFPGGEPNMVAKDGTRCGTSPAWCLPFYNLWLLYLRTLDRSWLAALVPRLEAYLEYWLRERTDEAGWIVYKCTYEAGEDCTPRLDPAAEGDEVISHFVRPVELQATFSQSAAILSRMAEELGHAEPAAHWSDVARDYAARTQSLWDDATGRYRDWDKRTNAFLRSPGVPSYWQTDPVRFSALSLAPLVAGIATPEQRARLRQEIELYETTPWCLWPSWSYVVAESASAAGWHDLAGRYAARIVDRVYRANDRRMLGEAPRPTPGTAPEFWPLDLADFNGSDGYGWGATTTSLWVRQIFGFQDGADPNESSFVLAPSLPSDLLQPGRRFGFAAIPYRGRRLDLAYEVTPTSLLAVAHLDRGEIQSVRDSLGNPVDLSRDHGHANFAVQNGAAVTVEFG